MFCTAQLPGFGLTELGAPDGAAEYLVDSGADIARVISSRCRARLTAAPTAAAAT